MAGGDHSLNAPLKMDGEGEWQDWLIDESESQETLLGERQELGNRRRMLNAALKGLFRVDADAKRQHVFELLR